MNSAINTLDQKATFEASFKKRKSGKLLWVEGKFSNESQARDGLRSYVATHYEGKGYLLYGGPMVKKNPMTLNLQNDETSG